MVLESPYCQLTYMLTFLCGQKRKSVDRSCLMKEASPYTHAHTIIHTFSPSFKFLSLLVPLSHAHTPSSSHSPPSSCPLFSLLLLDSPLSLSLSLLPFSPSLHPFFSSIPLLSPLSLFLSPSSLFSLPPPLFPLLPFPTSFLLLSLSPSQQIWCRSTSSG